MRRFDKNKSVKKANLLAEQRYLESKDLIKESFHDMDGTPIGVDHNHMPLKKEEIDYAKYGLIKHKKKWYNEDEEYREAIIWLPEPTTLVGPHTDEDWQLTLKKGDMIVPVSNEVPVKENNDEFFPGLSDSEWGLTVNMVTGHFPGGKDLHKVMLHNEDLIKKLDDPEVVNMIEVLLKYPEIISKLNP